MESHEDAQSTYHLDASRRILCMISINACRAPMSVSGPNLPILIIITFVKHVIIDGLPLFSLLLTFPCQSSLLYSTPLWLGAVSFPVALAFPREVLRVALTQSLTRPSVLMVLVLSSNSTSVTINGNRSSFHLQWPCPATNKNVRFLASLTHLHLSAPYL